MTITITCPNCNYSKTVPREKIPQGVRFANCPRCKERFEFAPLTPGFHLEAGENGPGSTRDFHVPPWENRSGTGIWLGIYQTWKSVLFSPGDFFGSMKSGEGIKEPFAFGLLVGSLGTMFGFFWQFLFFSGRSVPLGNALAGKLTINLIFFVIIIISPLFVIVNMFFTGFVIHACLRIVRGAKRYFEGTFRVVAYSQAAQMFSIIPFIGGLIGSLWHLIVLIIGLKAIHDISTGRVIIAFLLPLGLIFAAIAAIIFSLVLFG